MAAQSPKTILNILLVEISAQERLNVSSRLRTQNFEVMAATNGFHTIHLIEENTYDLVLVQSSMDDMSAREIILLVRSMATREELPLLFVADKEQYPGEDIDDVIEEMIEAGANNGIVKSANFQLLLNKINVFIPKKVTKKTTKKTTKKVTKKS